MIEITDIAGRICFINSDLIEKIEMVPDTVLILTNGRRYLIRDHHEKVIERIINFKRKHLQLAAVEHVN